MIFSHVYLILLTTKLYPSRPFYHPTCIMSSNSRYDLLYPACLDTQLELTHFAPHLEKKLAITQKVSHYSKQFTMSQDKL